MESSFSLVGSWLSQIIVFLALVFGVIVSIVKWKEHSRVALFTLLAFGLLLVDLIFGIVLNLWIATNFSYDQVTMFYSFKGIMHALIFSVAMILFVGAAFSHRKEISDAGI